MDIIEDKMLFNDMHVYLILSATVFLARCLVHLHSVTIIHTYIGKCKAFPMPKCNVVTTVTFGHGMYFELLYQNW